MLSLIVIKLLTPKFQLDGCTWYRSRQPLMMAHEMGWLHVMEFDPNVLTTEDVMKALKTADAFFLRFSFVQAADFIKEIRQLYPTKPIIFDIDDDYFDINPLNDFYATMGTREVYADGKPLWVEGKNFDPYKNRKMVIDYEYCLSHATAVTVTTEKLAEIASQYNDHVMVISNAIDPARFPKIKVEHDDLRLLWSGGSSHYKDLLTVKNDIVRLMKDYPNLNLYIYGQVFTGLFDEIDKSRCHFQGWVSADGHGYRLATVGADVAICPLEETPFNEKKSSIKYYEASALGIPTVAKNMLPYAEDINGENGLLYTNNLYDQVKKLLDNKELREKIGQNAYEWVLKNRNIETIAKDLADIINDLSQVSSGFEVRPSEPIKKFSVVFPCHNRINLVKQTLNSLIKNTPRELIEIIVVDDDSTDGTKEWLKEQEKLGNIDTLIDSVGHSCGFSKNIGMKYATCDYVYISDSDMYFGEDWYKDLIRIYPQLPPIILGTLGHPYWRTLKSYKVSDLEIQLVEQQPGNSWMISKDIWYKCGPLLEGVKYGEDDTEFCNRAKRQSIFIGHITSSVLHCGIKRSDGSTTYGAEEQIKDYPKGVIVE